MQTYTYTSVKTRTEAVVDQVDIFLKYAGIYENERNKIILGVKNMWLSDIGVYLTRNGKRFLEAEIGVDWTLHSNLVKLTPTIRTDLPGWEYGASPEVSTIGRRFGGKAQELNIHPNFWVRFARSIRDNPSYHRELCSKVGVSFNSHVPDWETKPHERAFTIQDLKEVHTALRSSDR
ncbi:MAG TPA: hypothetical protein P5280_03095 [Cyclobacteriaceae bacterium]|nr:hypothetical protein [Cyclobacteriaceae bacterium]